MTSADKYSARETASRTKTVLRGAFAGPPTPLKDIPTKAGESRTAKRKRPKKRRSKYA